MARKVRKDGTVSYQGAQFEVPYELAGRKVALVVDPHAGRVVGVEDEHGQPLGAASALDVHANLTRKRHKSTPSIAAAAGGAGPNMVELALRRHHGDGEV